MSYPPPGGQDRNGRRVKLEQGMPWIKPNYGFWDLCHLVLSLTFRFSL